MTVTTNVLPGTWVLDPARSSASFVARGLTTVHGTVPITAGRVEVDAAGQPVAVEAVLDLAELDTGNARRDRDLRSRRFLGTEEHPVMRFESRSCEVEGNGWVVTGVLRVAGHEAPMTLRVRAEGRDDPTQRVVFASGVLDRRDAGIKAPPFLIRKDVRLDLRATFSCH